MIETAEPSPHVVIHVVPRLLGDVLGIVLGERRLAVWTIPEPDTGDGSQPPQRFDLAIVTDGLAQDVVAERVIVIDDDGIPTGVADTSIEAAGGDGGLSMLLALIDDLLDQLPHARS